MNFAGGGGCEQVNLSLCEESTAFPDTVKDDGPIEHIYCIKTEDAKPIEEIYCIKTEDTGPIEQIYSVKTEDVAPIEVKNDLIETEEAAVSVEKEYYSVVSIKQEHHFVKTENESSAEEDITVEVKALDSNFKMPKEVCILYIHDLSVY